MASEFWEYFAADYPEDDDCDTNLDDQATDETQPFVYPTRDELLEQITHANATAKRLRHTAYYHRAHAHINTLLDTIVGR